MCFFVRGDSIVEKEFVFCYCLFAVSIFGDSTAFGHISLNSGSVYTPAVYYVKNMSVVVVLSKTLKRSRCQQPRPGKWALKLQLSTFHFDPFLFLRPSNSME